ncbi:hypothetical protein MUK70_21775 [Dyadobacter chenwenxiniae]|uniref:Outer membrane protein beta-barrel domain-containing protein n=1 Tax=Dyadobacter chenwenxiniae TaxID=2906456 RepID=A0A9X1TL54_9BACT|nr:hypothetical protein [Dyadobacter chenwenxiniae]MCF0061873.1 hypothetical protein [Dyadobacter chenwenxiniae]UON81688.1 hypothetical protein MUK70_21775 [Dyadobacter chenwenxiniae]
MKSKILLLCSVVFGILISPALMAQDDEYYRPDSLRKEKPEEVERPPVEQREVVEKKPLAEFKDRPFVDRLRLGGSFGLSLGTVTNINLSPMAGYELTEKLVGGVGVTGMYFRYKYYDINTLYYGGRAFLMYSVVPVVNIIAEAEVLNVEGSYQKRQWLTSPLVGAAYSQPTGGRFIKAVHFTALFNLNYNNQIDKYSGQNLSPYGSPFVFRVTFL